MTNANLPTKRTAGIQEMVLTALFTALLLLMGFTPLGLIDLPFIKATTLHIPVIIGSLVLGPWRGAFLGGVFGLLSIGKSTIAPSALSFAFSPFIPLPGESHGSPWALVIALIPRILVGVVPWFVVKLFEMIPANKTAMKSIGTVIAAVTGSAVNTGLVMGLMGLTLGGSFAAVKGIGGDEIWAGILAIVFANGVPEAIAAGVIAPVIVLALTKVLPSVRSGKGKQ